MIFFFSRVLRGYTLAKIHLIGPPAIYRGPWPIHNGFLKKNLEDIVVFIAWKVFTIILSVVFVARNPQFTFALKPQFKIIHVKRTFPFINELGLQGALAPNFYLNSEHILFVCIIRQKQKKFADFIKKISRIFIIYGNQILLETNFWKLDSIIHKPSLGSVPRKIWARLFPPFWLLLDTKNKQTDRQTDKPNLYIEEI